METILQNVPQELDSWLGWSEVLITRSVNYQYRDRDLKVKGSVCGYRGGHFIRNPREAFKLCFWWFQLWECQSTMEQRDLYFSTLHRSRHEADNSATLLVREILFGATITWRLIQNLQPRKFDDKYIWVQAKTVKTTIFPVRIIYLLSPKICIPSKKLSLVGHLWIKKTNGRVELGAQPNILFTTFQYSIYFSLFTTYCSQHFNILFTLQNILFTTFQYIG